MTEPVRRGELEREIRPMDMVCPEMGSPGSRSPNYWQRQCAARQEQRVCKCRVGRKVLAAAAEAAAKAARDKAERKKAAKEAKEKAMSRVETETDKPRCTVPGCWEPVLCKELCKSHYWKKKGEERKAKKKKEKTAPAASARPAKKTKKPPVIVDDDFGREGVPAPDRQEPQPAKEEKAVPKDKKESARNHIHEFSMRIFKRDEALYTDLAEAADRERRSISAEVLCRLERLMKIEAGE